MQVLLDLDPIVYATAFAAQRATYFVITEDEQGNIDQHIFTCGNEKLKFTRQLKKDGNLTVVDEDKHISVEPAEFSFMCLHQKFKTMQWDIVEEYKIAMKDITFFPFLTGKGNYREDIATVQEYKGSRKKVEKPIHYQAVRDYCVKTFHAEIIHGQEADDEIGIRAMYNDEALIATNDKDLDQIPGKHYNYNRRVFYTIDEDEADRFFRIQTLCGDSTDDIPGCVGIGETKAIKLVDELNYNWDEIVQEYANSQSHPKCKYKDRNPEDVALEMARLVRIRREEGEIWCPN